MLILLCVSVMNELRPIQRDNVAKDKGNCSKDSTKHNSFCKPPLYTYAHTADGCDTYPVCQRTTEGLLLFLGSSRIRHTESVIGLMGGHLMYCT